MYWIHGKAQFTRDQAPKTYTRYGPYTEIAVVRRAKQHIIDTIKRLGGITLTYSISSRKSS